MKIEYVKFNEINKAKYNPRTISEEMMLALVKGIKEFGMVQPAVINRTTGTLIGGHQRVTAAEQAGLEEMPVFYVELSEEKEKALNLALNKIGGDWDEQLLGQLLTELAGTEVDMELTGFADKEVDELLAQFEADQLEPGCDQDEVPATKEDAISVPGDVWILENHRVMCGNTCALTDITQLMDGEKADMVFTDPPYLMNFEGSLKGDGSKSYNSKHGKIENDCLSKEEGEQFIYDFCSIIAMHCTGAWYICFYRLGIDWLFEGLKKAGMKWRNQIIWKKNQRTLSNSDYKSIYEPIVYGFSDDYMPMLYGWNEEHEFQAGKKEIDVWEIDIPSLWEIERTRKNDLHPTMKPVALAERAVLNSSRAGQTVADFFGGSGTTVIACERQDALRA